MENVPDSTPLYKAAGQLGLNPRGEPPKFQCTCPRGRADGHTCQVNGNRWWCTECGTSGGVGDFITAAKATTERVCDSPVLVMSAGTEAGPAGPAEQVIPAPLGTPTLEALEELRRQQELDAEAERLAAEERERGEAEAWERIAAEENAAQAGRVTEEEYEAHREQAQQEARAEEQEAADPCALALAGIRALGKNPPPHELRAALRAFGEEVVKLNRLDRGIARGEALKLLPRGSAEVVDAVMPKAPPEPEENRLALANVEPWADRVDGAELLDELGSALRKYVVLPEGAAEAVSLWVLFSHAIDAFFVAPCLTLSSPDKRCGKTTLLCILADLTPRPLLSSNASAAVIYRAVDRFRPTLLLDESETFVNSDNEELRGILNSGHTRKTAYVLRCEPDSLEPRAYSTWAPKVFALIGKLPDTVADRSVVIPMRRKAPGETVAPVEAQSISQELAPLCRRAARWVADNLEALRQARAEVPSGISSDRARDNWRPLLAVADAAGGDWPARARRAALVLSGAEEESLSTRGELLRDMRDLFEARGWPVALATADVLEYLHSLESRPWPEWKHGRPMTPRALAGLLRPFKVEPRDHRLADGRKPKCYMLVELEPAFASYVPAHTPLPIRDIRDNAETTGGNGHSASATGNLLSRIENDENQNANKVVADVADCGPRGGEKERKSPAKQGRGGVL